MKQVFTHAALCVYAVWTPVLVFQIETQTLPGSQKMFLKFSTVFSSGFTSSSSLGDEPWM